MRLSLVCLGLAAALSFGGFATPAAATVNPQLYSGLRWRLIGPFRGGRALAVTGVAGNPTLFYFGAVAGGVWKTNDAGRTWQPIFDGERIASIGAIAVAPSDPNVIYVGSGEADMRSDISYGNGVYKSTDAGKSWRHIGLDDTRQIGRIVVDPRDPNTVFVAALGHGYGPNAQRGVFRSRDGGQTWQQVLRRNDDTGATDVAIDPSNPNTLFAALWQTRRPPWEMYPPSNGPGTGLYVTNDGGDTWQQIKGHGFPSAGVGRMGIAIARSDPKRVYAIVDAARGGLYASSDGGRDWRLVNAEERLWQRGWYFCEVAVDPSNADVVYVSDTALYRSVDGGAHFVPLKGSPDGDDFHQLWLDPTDGRHMVLGSDQGASVSVNGGQTWSSWYNQPTAQFYHVTTDDRFPFWAYGSQQDSGAAANPSRSNYLGITFRDWRAVTVGGESGSIAVDPLDPNILFGSGGPIDRYDQITAQDHDITPWLAHPGYYRQTWTVPIVASRAGPSEVYFGSQVLFRTRDGGNVWDVISPDLTRPNPAVPATLDPPTVADENHIGPRRGVIYAIAPSPLRGGEIWCGTDDGKIWLTLDDGARWRDVTPPSLSAWSKVGIIEASTFDAGTAYVAVDRHQLDDLRPYIYRTRDYGRSWKLVTSGIGVGRYVHVVREDPQRRGLLFAGTELGIYVSFDAGDSWQSLQANLPTTSVRDIAIRQDSLVIATHGRSLWILDDLAPLQQIGAVVERSRAWLYRPEVAYRVRPGDDQGERLPPEEPAGENRSSAAFIDYYLGAPAAGPMVLEILDAHGAIVRRYSSSDRATPIDLEKLEYPAYWARVAPALDSTPGMHRFAWDFHVAPLAGIHDQGPLAPPGRYTLRMIASGRTYSQPLVLQADPRVHASTEDLLAQFALAQRVEALRAQVESAYNAATALARRLPTASTLKKRIEALAGAPPESTPDNSIGYPETDVATLHFIAGALAALESAVESADVAPTRDDQTAFGQQKAALDAALARWRALESQARLRP